MMKNLVSIAGFDPSGGAGVLLDIRVFERLGCRGYGVLTAVTAQNPQRVDRIDPVAGRALAGQFSRLEEAIHVAGIKVGMLATAENLAAAGRILARHPRLPRIIDPVFRASSGALLLEEKAWPRFLAVVRGKADLITPNLDEAAILAGRPVRTLQEMRSAAALIAGAAHMACLVKGGHLEGRAVDVLYDGTDFTAFGHDRQVRSVHGTGCFLSAAILAYLAGGRRLGDACRLAIVRTSRAIRAAAPSGAGRWVFDLSPKRGRRRS